MFTASFIHRLDPIEGEETEYVSESVTRLEKATEEAKEYQQKLEFLLAKYPVNEYEGQTSYTIYFHNLDNLNSKYQNVKEDLEVQLFGHRAYSSTIQIPKLSKINHNGSVHYQINSIEDVGDIIMISIGNFGILGEMYFDYLTIVNNNNGKEWVVPLFDWISKNRYPFKIFHFCWVHQYEKFNLKVSMQNPKVEFDPDLDKKFVTYVINLQTDTYQWSIARRYSALERFFSLMKGKHPNPQIEKMFPPKQYLPGSSESLPTIKSRKLALKTYVREISKIEDVSSSLEFLATFNVPPSSILFGMKIGTTE